MSDESALEYDVFISHASEDKDGFVRSLAEALEARRIHVWYDELTLQPGDSLRRSIDRGLLTSQAGIVVLSQAFFSKRWPAYELDGLVELQNGETADVGADAHRRIIPIWHNVDVITVRRFSPSLANLVAIQSSLGVDEVANRVEAVLRPSGSALLSLTENSLSWQNRMDGRRTSSLMTGGSTPSSRVARVT